MNVLLNGVQDSAVQSVANAAYKKLIGIVNVILPILIGCVLVFGAVTLVSAMTDLAATVKESVG